MAKKKPKRIPRQGELSLSKAAGMAAATRGRARIFEDKFKKETPAKKQIADELGEMEK